MQAIDYIITLTIKLFGIIFHYSLHVLLWLYKWLIYLNQPTKSLKPKFIHLLNKCDKDTVLRTVVLEL